MFIATDLLFACKQHVRIIQAIIFCYQRRSESNQFFSLYHGARGIGRRTLSAFFQGNWISFAYFYWGCLPCLHTLIISLVSVMIFLKMSTTLPPSNFHLSLYSPILFSYRQKQPHSHFSLSLPGISVSSSHLTHL